MLLGILLALTFCGCTSTRQNPHTGRTYVITGASSGFGQGVALKLASQGANVVLAARRTELLEEVAAKARATGGTPLVVTTDVGKAEDVEKLAQITLAKFGRIDVWINNAGVGLIGRFWEIPLEDHSRMIDINLKGVVYGSHAALRQFRAQGYGTLVNIGSVESEVPLAYQNSYAASKAAVLSLSRALNEELRLNGLKRIKVATVLPWAADTPFFEHAGNYSGGTPRMAALDGPEKVVNAIVDMTVRPEEEIAVGWKAKGAYFSHRFFPDLTERISGNISHKYQIETAPPAPPTSGSLFQPVPSGRGVEGGVRQRMKREDEQRRQMRKP